MKLKSIFLLPVLFSLHGYADEEKSVTERIQFLEEQKGYPFKKRNFQPIAEGELLYWKADIDGVAYATTSIDEHAQGAIGDTNTYFKTRTPHFSYDPGFRLGLGFESPYDLFDIFVVWTRFYTEGHDKAHGTLVPIIAIPGDKLIFDGIGLIQQMASIPNRASAECHLKSNMVDVQLARGIEVSRIFFMRPYFGIRAFSMDIDWDINVDRDFIIPGIFDQDATELKVKNEFRAAGGLIGLEMDWKFSREFGLNARGAGALVYGPSEEKTKQKYVLIPAGTATVIKQEYKAENSTHCVKGLWEIFAGIFWERRFLSKKEREPHLLPKKQPRHVVLRLYAGYEFQQWPLMGQKTNSQGNRERERFSVGFQGFTGGAKLVF
ncbi:MAG: hypothetical protein JSS60_09615 [Verrucomicrobia bacterium]|nr:hypothetical protein [Verrucomicrobiota bacterium]